MEVWCKEGKEVILEIGNIGDKKAKKLCNSSNNQGNPKKECCQCFGIVTL